MFAVSNGFIGIMFCIDNDNVNTPVLVKAGSQYDISSHNASSVGGLGGGGGYLTSILYICVVLRTENPTCVVLVSLLLGERGSQIRGRLMANQ